MPAISPCVPACSSTIIPTNVPGVQGATGTNGVNSFTTTTNSFVIPAVNSTVTVPVVSTAFMAVGQILYVTDGVSKSIFQVSSIPSATSVVLTYYNDPTSTQAGNTMATNAFVTPSGFNGALASPLPVANGGTGSATKVGAQTNLGLGQSSTTSTVTGLTQAITASFVQVAGVSAVAPAAGKYLIGGLFTISWSGVTFSASRQITGKIRNTTSNVDYGSTIINTEILTTAVFPDSSVYIPFQVATLANGDNIQVLVTINTINSAGTLSTTMASVTLTPLALT